MIEETISYIIIIINNQVIRLLKNIFENKINAYWFCFTVFKVVVLSMSISSDSFIPKELLFFVTGNGATTPVWKSEFTTYIDILEMCIHYYR